MRAPDALFISVTEDNINQGVQGNGHHCPIARAIKDTYGDDPFVSGSKTAVTFDNGQAVYKTTLRAAWFIDRFDKKGASAVKPRKFKLKLVELNPYDNPWGEMGSQ